MSSPPLKSPTQYQIDQWASNRGLKVLLSGDLRGPNARNSSEDFAYEDTINGVNSGIKRVSRGADRKQC